MHLLVDVAGAEDLIAGWAYTVPSIGRGAISIGLDLPNTLTVLAVLAALFWVARSVARQIAEARPVAVVALSLWVFELVGLVVALAAVYLVWEASGRPTDECTGCEIFWAPLAIISALAGAGLGLAVGWFVLRRRAKA